MTKLGLSPESSDGGVEQISERSFDKVIVEIAESYARSAASISARTDELERLTAEAQLEKEKVFQTFLAAFEKCILRRNAISGNHFYALIHPRLVGHAVNLRFAGRSPSYPVLYDIDNKYIPAKEDIDFIYIPHNAGFAAEFFDRELVKEVCKFIEGS